MEQKKVGKCHDNNVPQADHRVSVAELRFGQHLDPQQEAGTEQNEAYENFGSFKNEKHIPEKMRICKRKSDQFIGPQF